MTAPRKSTRSQAPTAARRAFEARYGVKNPEENPVYQKLWEAFQAGWRLARGAKPTVRKDNQLGVWY